MTTEEILNVLENKLIHTCTKEERKEVFDFAFGEQFMQSDDKGELIITLSKPDKGEA